MLLWCRSRAPRKDDHLDQWPLKATNYEVGFRCMLSLKIDRKGHVVLQSSTWVKGTLHKAWYYAPLGSNTRCNVYVLCPRPWSNTSQSWFYAWRAPQDTLWTWVIAVAICFSLVWSQSSMCFSLAGPSRLFLSIFSLVWQWLLKIHLFSFFKIFLCLPSLLML